MNRLLCVDLISYFWLAGDQLLSSVPVSQDISEPDESEPFRFILALAAGYFGTIPINPDPSGRIFRNHQDISEPTIRSSALMNF